MGVSINSSMPLASGTLNLAQPSLPVQWQNPRGGAGSVGAASQSCGSSNKPLTTKGQFNLVAVVTAAQTVYLPSFDGFAELISGRPSSLEGATNLIGNNSKFYVQELFDFGNEPSSTTDGVFGGEYTYTNATTNILGAVTPSSASAFMRRVAMLPMLIVQVQMAIAESTSIITTLSGFYGNLSGNTGFQRKLVSAQVVSGANTLYVNNETWWLTGNTQLFAVAPAAGTYRWTFTVGEYGDNFTDCSSAF